MDFAKAFDKVAHNKLIQKLNRYGIRGPINRWTEHFLNNRQQRVVCEGQTSTWEPVTSGISQGSVIGPILFLVYFNDLHDTLQSKTRLFADDTIVYLTVANDLDAEALQDDLNKLAECEHKLQMEFHLKKGNILRITRSRKPHIYDYTLPSHILEAKAITRNLSWNEHIINVCKTKVNLSVDFLHHNLQLSQQYIKENPCKTLIRPLAEYVSSVWDPYTHENQSSKREMIPRRGARYLKNAYSHESSITEMIRCLGWHSLQQHGLYEINGHIAVDY